MLDDEKRPLAGMHDPTRCRIISFRLSDDEYEAVEAARRRHGFKSVSLFARSAILQGNAGEPGVTPSEDEMTRLWRRLDALTAALESAVGQLPLPGAVAEIPAAQNHR